MMLMGGLVDDVIGDILVRLPVKDVVRFRCLSKSLCTTIDSPAFVAAHLNHSVHTKSRRKLIFFGATSDDADRYMDCRDYYNYAIDFDLEDSELDHDHDDQTSSLSSVVKLYLNSPWETPTYRDVIFGGSCNGLVLVDNGFRILLWNPFTKRYKTISLHGADYFTSYQTQLGLGLGYDSGSNDYKLVTVQRISNIHNDDDGPRHLKVGVFSLATGTWTTTPKLVHDVPFRNDRAHMCRKAGVFANGALHWIWCTTNYHTFHVLSFHVSKQVFVRMFPPIPPTDVNDYIYNLTDLSLEVMDGRLLLGLRKPEELTLYEAKPVAAAVGEDHNNNNNNNNNISNWTKLLKLDCEPPSALDVKLMDYSKDGSKILFKYPDTIDGQFFWYDLRRGSCEPAAHIPSLPHTDTAQPDLPPLHDTTFCLETLAPLGDDALFDGLHPLALAEAAAEAALNNSMVHIFQDICTINNHEVSSS